MQGENAWSNITNRIETCLCRGGPTQVDQLYFRLRNMWLERCAIQLIIYVKSLFSKGGLAIHIV